MDFKNLLKSINISKDFGFKKNLISNNAKKGFSLLELSIVILITSILMTGALSITLNFDGRTKEKVTKERMDIIYNALGAYFLKYRQLPCPAQLKKSKILDADYGQAATNIGVCNFGANTSVYTNIIGNNILAYGMVPIKDLGLPVEMAEDAYGSKFSYIVDKNMTYSISFRDNGSTINYGEKPVDSTIVLGANAPFAIISHGPNRAGAFLADSRIQNTLPVGDEIRNTVQITNEAASVPEGTFAGTGLNSILKSSGNNDLFDDIVKTGITRQNFVTNFNADGYIGCPASSSSLVIYGTTLSWSVAYYGEIRTSNVACPSGWQGGATYATRKCGLDAIWGNIVTPCVSG